MHRRSSVNRITRYQGAIIRHHHILLIKQVEHASSRSYWLLPGGRIEREEIEENCVQREMLEETGLHVQVHSLLLDELNIVRRSYQRRKTYLCSLVNGEARPGYEPEAAYATAYSFTEVDWFDLRHPTSWNEQIVHDPITYPLLQRLQAALGYVVVDMS